MKCAIAAFLLLLGLLGAAQSGVTVTAQILDYERGWLFITTGDGFRVAPSVTVLAGPPRAREYARITFDASGVVTKIEVSQTKLPPQGDLAAIHRYAVSLSAPVPNPELDNPIVSGRCARTRSGKLVGLTLTVQVPVTTAATDTVYMTTDQSGWNAQAYRLDRIDALHYRSTLKLYSGTVLHVLFDRGSTQSIQVGQNGLEISPYVVCIGDEDAQAFRAIVYRWGDEQNGQTQQMPQTMPTPYNPAPFPNLPSPPPGLPSPLPH
jgi:hypothetical protein